MPPMRVTYFVHSSTRTLAVDAMTALIVLVATHDDSRTLLITDSSASASVPHHTSDLRCVTILHKRGRSVVCVEATPLALMLWPVLIQNIYTRG